MRTERRGLIAANIRARLAWSGVSATEVENKLGWSKKTTYNKLHGITSWTAEELEIIAEALDVPADALFQEPPNFPSLSSPSASSNAALAA